MFGTRLENGKKLKFFFLTLEQLGEYKPKDEMFASKEWRLRLHLGFALLNQTIRQAFNACRAMRYAAAEARSLSRPLELLVRYNVKMIEYAVRGAVEQPVYELCVKGLELACVGVEEDSDSVICALRLLGRLVAALSQRQIDLAKTYAVRFSLMLETIQVCLVIIVFYVCFFPKHSCQAVIISGHNRATG
jgi:hypothetical protein